MKVKRYIVRSVIQFEQSGQKVLDMIATHRSVAIFLFIIVFGLLQIASADRAESFAAGAAAILAGLGILVLVRTEDAGFQSAENQKRFLNALATQLSVLSRNLALITGDPQTGKGARELSQDEYQRLLGSQHAALTSYYDAELSTLVVLDSALKNKGRQSLYSHYVEVIFGLSALVAGAAPEYSDELPGWQKSRVIRQHAIYLLNALAEIDIETLRTAHACIGRTTNVLELAAEAAQQPSIEHFPECTSLANDIGGEAALRPELVERLEKALKQSSLDLNHPSIAAQYNEANLVSWAKTWSTIRETAEGRDGELNWAEIEQILKEENQPSHLGSDIEHTLPSILALMSFDDTQHILEGENKQEEEEEERKRIEQNNKLRIQAGLKPFNVDNLMANYRKAWFRHNYLSQTARRIDRERREIVGKN